MQSATCNTLPKGSNMEEHCYQDTAVRAGIPSICDKITGKSFSNFKRNPRRNKCYRRVAGKLGDSTLCNQLTPGSIAKTENGCYMLVALSEYDVSICNKINDNYMKKKCIEKVEKSFPYCRGEKNNKNKDKYNECILKTAIKEDSFS